VVVTPIVGLLTCRSSELLITRDLFLRKMYQTIRAANNTTRADPIPIPADAPALSPEDVLCLEEKTPGEDEVAEEDDVAGADDVAEDDSPKVVV
jgi:hypothetical protein